MQAMFGPVQPQHGKCRWCCCTGITTQRWPIPFYKGLFIHTRKKCLTASQQPRGKQRRQWQGSEWVSRIRTSTGLFGSVSHATCRNGSDCSRFHLEQVSVFWKCIYAYQSGGKATDPFPTRYDLYLPRYEDPRRQSWQGISASDLSVSLNTCFVRKCMTV